MNNVWAHRVLRESGAEVYQYEGIEAEVAVEVDQVELAHHGPETNYRPYLHASGELRRVSPVGEDQLPYGITDVTYDRGSSERVDIFYEFDDQQLADLSAKGYFSRAFGVPEEISGIEWEVPGRADVLVLAPSAETEGDAPVVFVGVHDAGDLRIDLESSGYDMAEYFHDHSEQASRSAEAPSAVRSVRERSDQLDSLFSEEELGLTEQQVADAAREAAAQQPSPAAGEDFGSRLEQVAAETEAEAEAFWSKLAETEGTPENLYAQRVASVLAETEPSAGPSADAAEAEAERERGSDDLDLFSDEEDELEEEKAERERTE